ncbi:MAG: DNA replication and repair protein RecF [Candidatus Shapirobacteria bacterium]|nr:DNA replication and repair protein RecF [Candidatus Shapirobacteria bacterium]
MFLKEISLTDFRNYDQIKFQFSNGINLILGPNASGKSNLLEAIFLLSTGRSFRAGKVSQIIKHQSLVAHLKALVIDEGGEQTKLASVLSRGEVNGKKTPLRQFSADGVKKPQAKFAGNLLTVLFSPQDLDIITDSPSFRRRFLDDVLDQSDRDYYRANLSYHKGLRSRNRVLEQIRAGQTTPKALFFWDRLLLENGQKISQRREKLIDFINQQQSSAGYEISYQPSIIFPKKLAEKQSAEIAAGQTLFGPHRDDFLVFTDNRDLAIFGSRGEQRLSVLWLKLGQLRFLEQATQKQPVLLLDDIFSELDREHKKLVVASFIGHQTLVTAAENIALDCQVNLIRLN